MEAPFATLAAVRVGWRGFEGLGRPWEGWLYDGRRWVCGPRRLTRGGALVAALDLAATHMAQEREGDSIVSAARDAGGAAPEGARLDIGSDGSRYRAAQQRAENEGGTIRDG